MDQYPLVSVYTCVYNGERTIHRVFESLKNLDYPNIEHVIVNDGSTDGTDALVQEYIGQVSFPVKYHKQENGGKHSALNVAWDLAEGDFWVQLDADDRLLPHSVRFLVETYFQIPEDIRHEYWCVHGRFVTQAGKFVGIPYPEDINRDHWSISGERARRDFRSGDKLGMQVGKYLNHYRFPDVKGISHIPEGIIWDQINKLYGTWYTNEVVAVNYVKEGGNLTASKTTRKQFGAPAFRLKWRIMHEPKYSNSPKALLRYSLLYCAADDNFRKHNAYLEGIERHRVFLRLVRPAAFVGAFLYRTLKGIK